MHPPSLPLDLSLTFPPLDFVSTPPPPSFDLFLNTSMFPLESTLDQSCWWLESPFMSPPPTPTDTTEFTVASNKPPCKKRKKAPIEEDQQHEDLEDDDEDEEEELELPDSFIYWDADSQRSYLNTWDVAKLIEYIVKMSQPTTSTSRICVKHKLAAVDSLGQRLPSYEDLIAEALMHLNQKNQEHFGCQPRFIFKWMAEKYKGLLPYNFRGSATQALKKAWRKGRFLRHERKYRINPHWKPPCVPKLNS